MLSIFAISWNYGITEPVSVTKTASNEDRFEKLRGEGMSVTYQCTPWTRPLDTPLVKQ